MCRVVRAYGCRFSVQGGTRQTPAVGICTAAVGFWQRFESRAACVRTGSSSTGRGRVVDYSRAPEAQFPIALEQTYAALRAVAEYGDEWGLDSSRLAIAGDSAGGNLAAAAALLTRQRGGPELALQVLFCPMLDAQFDRASYSEFAEGPLVTRSAMQWFWSAYAPDSRTRLRPFGVSTAQYAGGFARHRTRRRDHERVRRGSR